MYKTCSFRKIRITMFFILIVLSCSTNTTQPVNNGIGHTIESIPEGILITFNTIPLDTTSMFIRFESRKNNDQNLESSTEGSTLDSYNVFEAYAMIYDELFEQIKNSQKIICPFIQPGAQYEIFISFFNKDGESGGDMNIETEFTADTGIYPVNEFKLSLNDNNTSVQVSAIPLFSSNVEFPLNKYSFSFNLTSAQGTFGTSTDMLEENLYWEFESSINENVKLWKKDALRRGKDISGNHSAWITFSCNLLYDNIQWKVNLAKTQVFTYSL